MKLNLGTNIKQKLTINAVLVAAGMVLMLLLQIHSNAKNSTYSLAIQQLENFSSSTHQLRVYEKRFLAEKDLAIVDEFNQLSDNKIAMLVQFKQTAEQESLPTASVQKFSNALSDYKTQFNTLVAMQQNIGLHPKDGLYGELRGAVHNIETLLKEQDNYQLLADMLQLRRSEKDFMLRYDIKYLDRFNSGIDTLKANIEDSYIDYETQSKLQGFLAEYKGKFANLVNEEQTKGLDGNSGIRGELAAAVTMLDQGQMEMEVAISESISEAKTKTQLIGFIVFAIIISIVLASTFVTSRKVLTPIKEISDSITLVREHNDLTTDLVFDGADEVSDMGRQFNSLIADFRELINKVVDAVQSLDNATVTLVNNSQENQDSLDLQLRETESVAAAVTQMGATIKEIASNTEDAAAKAQSSNDNAERGYVQVNMTIESIKDLSDNLATAVQDVTELAEESKNVGSVLDVIRGIAEQTNLLALNAAIEAARAGEHGRGFAVVADEVRTLAMRTQESTKEIENIISSLQGRIGSIVSVIDQCQEQGTTSTTRAAEAGDKLNSITADVKVIMDMNTQIATAIEQQSAVAEEVNENVVAIRDVADSSFNRAKDNAASSSQISEQAQILRSFIDKYKV